MEPRLTSRLFWCKAIHALLELYPWKKFSNSFQNDLVMALIESIEKDTIMARWEKGIHRSRKNMCKSQKEEEQMSQDTASSWGGDGAWWRASRRQFMTRATLRKGVLPTFRAKWGEWHDQIYVSQRLFWLECGVVSSRGGCCHNPDEAQWGSDPTQLQQ